MIELTVLTSEKTEDEGENALIFRKYFGCYHDIKWGWRLVIHEKEIQSPKEYFSSNL
jgi:hypothetical protein